MSEGLKGLKVQLPAAFKGSMGLRGLRFGQGFRRLFEWFNCLRRLKGSGVQLPAAFKGSKGFEVTITLKENFSFYT
jgi:hypothetical protein